MATFYSNEYTAQYRTLPMDTNIHRNKSNPCRYLYFSYTQVGNGAIDDFLYLRKVPADCRIIIPECKFYFSAWDTNTLLDVGWAAYTAKDGSAVAADFDGLIDGLDIDAAGYYSGFNLSTAGGVAFVNVPALFSKEFNSRHEVDIVAQFRVAAPTNTDTLEGLIAYII